MSRTIPAATRTFIERMPKAELHVHLEGSVYPDTLLDLARKHGVALPINNVSDAEQWFRFTNFAHFVEIYLSICSVLLDEEDFARIPALLDRVVVPETEAEEPVPAPEPEPDSVQLGLF